MGPLLLHAARPSRRGAGRPRLALDGSTATVSLTFTATAGGPDPAPQTIAVSNAGGTGTLGVPAPSTPTYTAGASGWLAATYDATTHLVTVTPTTGALPANTHVAVFDLTDANGGTITVTVTFTVNPGATPAIVLTPSAPATFSAPEGGSNPAPQTFAITNGGTGTLATCVPTITYGAGQPTGWLSAAVTGSGNSQTLTLTPTTGALTAQTLDYSVSVASAGATNTPQVLAGSFVVSAAAGGGTFAAPRWTLPYDENGVQLVHNAADDTIDTSTFINTGSVLTGGAVHRVVDTGNPVNNLTALRNAELAAVRGDMIVWDDGIVFEGVWTPKDYGAGTQWVSYMSCAIYNRAAGSLVYGSNMFPVDAPVPGTRAHWWSRRVPLSATAMMATIYATTNNTGSGAGCVKIVAPSTRSYLRICGLQCTTNPAWTGVTENNMNGVIVQSGDATDCATLARIPHHIVWDRCLVRPQPAHVAYRGMTIVSSHTALLGCRVIDTKGGAEAGSHSDTQAILYQLSPGHLHLSGSEIEGGDESIMLGYQSCAATGVATADVVVEGCWLHKNPAYKGIYKIKNVLETKSLVRCLAQFNEVSHFWHDQQHYAFTTKVVPDLVSRPTSTRDWTVRYNYFHDVAATYGLSGIDTSGGQNAAGAIAPSRFQIYNNYHERTNLGAMSGSDACQKLGGTSDLVVHNQTYRQFGGNPGKQFGQLNGATPQATNVEFRDNIGFFCTYAYVSGTAPYKGITGGALAFSSVWGGTVLFEHDVLYGVASGDLNPDHTYKNQTSWPSPAWGFAAEDAIGWDGTLPGHLAAGSPLVGAGTDGRDRGVMNWALLDDVVANAGV